MKIHKLINPENVFLDLAAADVESALAAVAEVFSPSLSLEPQGVVDALVERKSSVRPRSEMDSPYLTAKPRGSATSRSRSQGSPTG